MHDQPYLPSLVAKRNQINRLNAEAARAKSEALGNPEIRAEQERREREQAALESARQGVEDALDGIFQDNTPLHPRAQAENERMFALLEPTERDLVIKVIDKRRAEPALVRAVIVALGRAGGLPYLPAEFQRPPAQTIDQALQRDEQDARALGGYARSFMPTI